MARRRSSAPERQRAEHCLTVSVAKTAEPRKACTLDVYEALYTTRSMRRLRPDSIPYDVQARILDAAIRAPNPGNSQAWRFLLVDDPAIKLELARLYQESQVQGLAAHYAAQAEETGVSVEEVERAEAPRLRSAKHLAEHWADVPLFLFAFVRDDPTGGTIMPAVWSAMLAARAEGVGSTLTTLLSLFRAAETMALLGVPRDEEWTMAACVPLGYPAGRWGIAARQPVDDVAARNRWEGPLGFSVPEPLYGGDGVIGC
jgi:nitroreductase